jgi:hypothetical protein
LVPHLHLHRLELLRRQDFVILRRKINLLLPSLLDANLSLSPPSVSRYFCAKPFFTPLDPSASPTFVALSGLFIAVTYAKTSSIALVPHKTNAA